MIELRTAIDADIPLLKEWDNEDQVISASGMGNGYDWDAEVPRSVSWRDILIAHDGDHSIGAVVIIDPRQEETHYWGEIEPNLRAIDIWIGKAADRGRGLGTKIMNAVFNRCFAEPATNAILVDPLFSNARAIAFYKRIGFRVIERRTFASDDCLVLRIDRGAWEETQAGSRL